MSVWVPDAFFDGAKVVDAWFFNTDLYILEAVELATKWSGCVEVFARGVLWYPVNLFSRSQWVKTSKLHVQALVCKDRHQGRRIGCRCAATGYANVNLRRRRTGERWTTRWIWRWHYGRCSRCCNDDSFDMRIQGCYSVLNKAQVVCARGVHVNINATECVCDPTTRVGSRTRGAVFTRGYPVHRSPRLNAV